MKRIFLAFTFLFSTGALADAPSHFLAQTLTQAQAILTEKDDTVRINEMCGLLKQSLNTSYISNVWLGTYGAIEREATAIAQFPSLVPSVMMTKAIPLLTGGGEGSVTVDPVSKVRAPNVYEVGVTITVNAKDYRGAAVVEEVGAGLFKINDAEYMGLSAVNYQGRDFQNFMKREFESDPENSMPVTALIQHITSETDYINCP